MGEVVDIGRYATARDRALLVEILQSAQLAQAYAGYGRAAFLGSPDDQRKIAERLAAMADATRKLSRALRERTPDVPWEQLLASVDERDTPDPGATWTTVKKVVPSVVRALTPLVSRSEKTVFLWARERQAKRQATKPRIRPGAKRKRRGR